METVQRIEPTWLASLDEETNDVILQIARVAGALDAKLDPKTAASLVELVRVMNCYYSNRIEGHNTRPQDIERALENELDEDEQTRNLQIESRAHVHVQRLIDQQYASDILPEPASVDFIRWLHSSFYKDAPDAMLRVSGDGGSFLMVPGELRRKPVHDNRVGQHVPPGSSYVSEFMGYFQERYVFEGARDFRRVVMIPLAHHRFNYIHPFPDGNGRVSRLMSHAMVLRAGIGARGLWSISRGLARGLGDRDAYKRMMALADSKRQNDYDGRGNLSEKMTREFVRWFLDVTLDQLQFMSELFDLSGLGKRLEAYVTRRPELRAECGYILKEVLRCGEMPRGDAARVSGLKVRSARSAMADLIKDGILSSDSPKGAVHLVFRQTTADELFPRLYPPDVA